MSSETLQRVLPAPAVEAASKVYLEDLAKGIGAARTVDLTKLYGSQFVAPESQLTQQARSLAPGLGGYQPFLQQAQQFQQAAQASTGPQAYQQYMSPYQQAVMDTTLREYDIQSQKGLPGLAASAIQQGAFGGGREGVQRAEYQSASDRNRAALQAQLLQQGYGQAQQAAQQNYMNQLNLGQSAIGLGQTNVGMLGQQIAGLQTLGAGETSQQQALLEAQRQLAQQQAYQPLNIAERYGAGIQPLIAGQPGGLGYSTIKSEPTPSPLTNLLGIGSTLAGIYALTRPR
jgi:Arc/MetJ-type ribon-helix-helix transcriptional regulator